MNRIKNTVSQLDQGTAARERATTPCTIDTVGPGLRGATPCQVDGPAALSGATPCQVDGPAALNGATPCTIDADSRPASPDDPAEERSERPALSPLTDR